MINGSLKMKHRVVVESIETSAGTFYNSFCEVCYKTSAKRDTPDAARVQLENYECNGRVVNIDRIKK